MKRRGRPPLAPDQKLVKITTNLTPAQADEICRRALHERMSVSEFLRVIVSQSFWKRLNRTE